MGQYVEIESAWGAPVFHCPVCGQVVFADDGGPTSQPCGHVLFGWIKQVGDIYNAAVDIQGLLAEDESWHSPASEECVDRCPETAVLFPFSSCKTGCGPASLTDMHAIQFPDDVNEGEEDVR
jgi:hypothetical protein